MKYLNEKVLEAAQIGVLALMFGTAAHQGLQAVLPTAQAGHTAQPEHKVTSPCDAKTAPPICGFVIGQ